MTSSAKEFVFRGNIPCGTLDNNWHITKSAVGDMEDDQVDLCKQIFNGLHSDEYRDVVYKQVKEDSPVVSRTVQLLSLVNPVRANSNCVNRPACDPALRWRFP